MVLPGRKFLRLQDAKAAAVRIGLKLSDQDLDRAFEAAHLNGSDTLDFNDFLTALTVLILQIVSPAQSLTQTDRHYRLLSLLLYCGVPFWSGEEWSM